jgi:tetratricopeptide (TPR) repeat protein
MKILLLILLVGCAGQNLASKSVPTISAKEEVKNNFTPNEAGYWINLGINARLKKDFTPGLYAFNRGLSMGKNDQEKILAHQGMALLLLDFSNVEEAKIHYDKVLEMSKKNKDVNLKEFTAEYQEITQKLSTTSKI